MSRSYTTGELAAIVGGALRGRGSSVIRGVADLAEAEPDSAAWVSRAKYASLLSACRAGVVLVPEDQGPTSMPAILCPRVDRSVAKLFGAFAEEAPPREAGIHPSAIVHRTATVAASATVGPHAVIEAGAAIGERSRIEAGVFIGRGTRVGADCHIEPNAVVREGCRLGDRVTIQPGAVIGADGFGYYFDEGGHQRVPHIGGVVLEDDVEVGACACVDRAKFGNTVIGRGTKIDNLVQIAHNVRLGRHNVLAGQTGISGSVRTGDYCVFGARGASLDNITLGDRVRLGALAVATKDIPAGMTVSGAPAQDHRMELRERATIRRLPDLVAQLRNLIARVERLETSADDNA